MPRDYEMKINRGTMTVMISNGLSKQSSKISQRFSFYRFIVFTGPNQANAEKPRGLQFKPTNTYVAMIEMMRFVMMY